MMNNNISTLTSTEITAIISATKTAYEAAEKFSEEIKRSFLGFEIDFETNSKLSTFYSRAFFEAIIEMNENRVEFYAEDFQKELNGIDYVCENTPEVFTESLSRMAALQEYKMALMALGRLMGYEE